MRKQLWIGRRWLKNYLDRHVYGAWQKLGPARWMFVSWLLIVAVSIWGLSSSIVGLSKYYVTTQPVQGGIYTEGLLGEVRILNPILPENTATSDVNRLIFSGLTRVNAQRTIEPDLAARWEVSPDQKTYTFYLRKDVVWHDGQKFTSKDVAFTVAAIQNPDSKSPLAFNWQGIKFDRIDDYTIKFTLPNSYSSFLSATTVGMLPSHLLESIQLSQLRVNAFSQRPIGTGPFELEDFGSDKGLITLRSNPDYYRGEPKLDEVHFALYKTTDALLAGYARKQIMGISQITTSQLDAAQKIKGLKIYEYSLPAYVGLFFNTKNSYLADSEVRRALAQAVDRESIISSSLSDRAVPVYYPILPGQTGFNSSAVRYQYDLAAAEKLLTTKKPPKALKLVTLKSPEYSTVARQVAQQLGMAGIAVEVKEVDIVSLQQNHIRPRNYDLLLYGQNVGIDPDTYAFWHSSQAADPGLNISSYKNTEADKLLEAARLARDPSARSSKFSSFVDVWAKEAPAVLIYSPLYLYGQDLRVEGVNAGKISEPSDRFYGIENWSMLRERVLKRDARQ